MIHSFTTQLILSMITGYILCFIVSGKYEGDKLERSLILKAGVWRIHIHHWIWCSAILLILVTNKFYNPIPFGLLLGSIIQGLHYRDRLVVIYRAGDFKKIYARFKRKPQNSSI